MAYGYKNVPPTLYFLVLQVLYIDLRRDIASFLSLSLNKKILYIINKYLNIIKKIHDKIEFELVETCFLFYLMIK